MRVAPLPSDAVIPAVRPSQSKRTSRHSTQTSRTSSTFGYWKKVEPSSRDSFAQWLLVIGTTSCLGLLSASAQWQEHNVGLMVTAITISSACLLLSTSSVFFHSRLRRDMMEVFFLIQVVAMNVTLMMLPLSQEDPLDRARYFTWESAYFKLIPLACSRFSSALLQLASSIAIDAALQVSASLSQDGNVSMDWPSVVFLVSLSAYGLILSFFGTRRMRRSEAKEQSLQELLDKVLTEAFSSWVLLDQDFHVRRSVKDLKFRKSRHSALHAGVLDLLLGFKDDPAATTGLREAFQAAEFSGSGTARTRTTMRTAAGQEEQPVELVVLRSRGHDPRGSVRRSNSKLKDRDDDARCCCDAETEWPCYVVGISSEPWPAGPPVGAVASARSRNSGPEPAPERASGRSPGGRRNSGASNSLMPSDEGGSADASVISAARDQQKLIGIGDNHSSSVFDIQPPTVETEGGRKSFSELVELGRREHWIVEPHQLCLLGDSVLGSGTFGTVLRGTFYGASVAIKMPKAEKKEHLPLLNELRTLRRLRHPNIVLFLGAHVVPSTNDMALVFELVKGQTLHDWLKGQPHPISCDAGKVNIIRDISLALRYMHQQDKTLVHGDLKPTNVFVEDNLETRAKLGDFGLSRFLYKTEQAMGGSLRWMAPEIATGHDRSPSCAADVFSLGALLSFTLTDVKPFEGVDRNQILKMMCRGSVPALTWPSTEEDECVLRIALLGDSCYSMNPVKRPDIMQVLEVLEMCRGLGAEVEGPLLV